MAMLCRRICTEHVEPRGLAALLACKLIPLNKNPGVRPIGVGETLRRILGKAALVVVGPSVQAASGALQLCSGQVAGIEAAVHSMSSIFANEEVDGVLLVDAKNAFNSLNRQSALRNIARSCPS